MVRNDKEDGPWSGVCEVREKRADARKTARKNRSNDVV
jgi:hypothetical protein